VKGYDPGPIDDIIGARTKAAILQFQKDNNLATGNALSLETLKALGVSE
jgi:peptidoglycan hydrolase-like protein with peptidoglycan-binding domain